MKKTKFENDIPIMGPTIFDGVNEHISITEIDEYCLNLIKNQSKVNKKQNNYNKINIK